MFCASFVVQSTPQYYFVLQSLQTSVLGSTWHKNSQEELSWHMGRHGMRWEELRWDELRWSASVKCGVWGVKSAMRSVRKVFALYRGRAQVMFLDSNTATASHKARTHGPGWRMAHASSLVVVLGSDSWKPRWHMRRDEMRRDELG